MAIFATDVGERADLERFAKTAGLTKAHAVAADATQVTALAHMLERGQRMRVRGCIPLSIFSGMAGLAARRADKGRGAFFGGRAGDVGVFAQRAQGLIEGVYALGDVVGIGQRFFDADRRDAEIATLGGPRFFELGDLRL